MNSNLRKFNRVLIKISGESLRGGSSIAISEDIAMKITKSIAGAVKKGIQVAIVIGGGNFIRGRSCDFRYIDRVTLDYMGMLSTIINSLALRDIFKKNNIESVVQSSFDIKETCEPFNVYEAIGHLIAGRVVIFAGGTGNPYFSTDTAASLRAIEIQADILLKATMVDGVYDIDPLKFKSAKLIKKINHFDFLKKRLKVMDSTAVSLCMENMMNIYVFNVNQENSISRIIDGDEIGTFIGCLSGKKNQRTVL